MEANSNNNSNSNVIAPFVMKTYQMVNDPSTDTLITWGLANNSFIVLDPLDFSQLILPAYFKHNNFSSFIRQLNTYGFKKVDPDNWEFANEWFLRGQKHLLKNISRRKQTTKNSILQPKLEDFDNNQEMVIEIARLKEEQRALEQELEGMNQRLQATERRPHQMMAFLYKVVQDPDLLPRMMLEKERTRRLNDKKPRIMLSSSSTSSGTALSSSVKTEEEDDGTPGVTSSPETGFDADNKLCQSSPSPETTSTGYIEQGNNGHAAVLVSPVSVGAGFGTAVAVSPMPANCMVGYDGDRSGEIIYFREMAVGVEGKPPPPYPFSLLGGGFY